MLSVCIDVAAEERCIGEGVQRRTGVKGAIRDRFEDEARTEQEYYQDAIDPVEWMEESTLTGEDMEGG
jgi:hypothetical protein